MKKPSIFTKVVANIALANTPTTPQKLYKIIDFKRHSIRARLHEATKRGFIQRIGKGLYIKIGAQVGQQVDTRLAISELAKAKAKFDFVVLDLPWKSSGTKGGNRNLADFDVISPSEFGQICKNLRQMLKSDNTPVLFFFSVGKTSAKVKAAYQAEIDKHFKRAAYGEYAKTYKDGSPCKFGKYLLPNEGMWCYSISGQLDHEIDLNISAIRPNRTYATRKATSLLKRIFSQALRDIKNPIVFDPFGGSGSTAETCEMLDNVSSLSWDIAHNPVLWSKAG